VNGIESIQISATDVEQQLPEAMERIKAKAMLDDEYREIWKQVSKEGNADKGFSISNELLGLKNRIYEFEGLRQLIIQSERGLKLAGHFGTERSLEQVTRNIHWTNMEGDMRKNCNECDICQRTKASRYPKRGLSHHLELACKQWTHISTDFITDLLESERATMTPVVVDRANKMVNFIPTKKKDSQTVAKAYLDNV